MSYVLDGRLHFHVAEMPPPQVAEALRAIPGVQVWKNRRIVCPQNAGKIVNAYCKKFNLDVTHVTSTVEPVIKPGWLTPRETKAKIDAIRELRPLIDGVAPMWTFLRPFQRWALSFVMHPSRDGGFLFSPVGSGKSIMSVVWALSGPEKRPVVIATKASVRYQFADEIRRVAVVEPYVLAPKPRRKRDLAAWMSIEEYIGRQRARGTRPVVIVGWEGFADYAMELAVIPRPFDIVADESQYIKAAKRGRWQVPVDDAEDDFEAPPPEFIPNDGRAWTASRLSRSAMGRRLALTGTPIFDRVVDLWGQSDFLVHDGFGYNSAAKFKIRYAGAVEGDYGLVIPKGTGITHGDELKERLDNFVVRIPHAIVRKDLPPKRRAIVTIPLEQQANRGWGLGAVGKEVRQLTKGIPGKKIAEDAMDENARAVLDRVTELALEEAAMRAMPFILNRVIDQLDNGAGKRKLFILSGRHAITDHFGKELVKQLGKWTTPPTVWTTHGDLHDDWEREQIRKAYMDHPGPCVLNATWQSFGEGLNLQDTDYIGVMQLPYSPGVYEQLEGRGERLGMTRPLLVEYFVPLNTIAERVRFLVLDKLPAVTALVGDASSLGPSVIDDFKMAEGRGARMETLKNKIASWFKNSSGEIELNRRDLDEEDE